LHHAIPVVFPSANQQIQCVARSTQELAAAAKWQLIDAADYQAVGAIRGRERSGGEAVLVV